jgi:hypothetical protein
MISADAAAQRRIRPADARTGRGELEAAAGLE